MNSIKIDDDSTNTYCTWGVDRGVSASPFHHLQAAEGIMSYRVTWLIEPTTVQHYAHMIMYP